MELIHLQHYWWFLISLLGGLLTFLLFVQGGQSMLYSLCKTSQERDLVVNTLGHQWEYTFTTLVVFGGAFFASFPLFYSTSFGGAYIVWMLILFSFVVQAVSYEYRKKENNLLGSRTYELFLQFNGFVAPFLIGAAVGTFFTGQPFKLNYMNQVEWMTRWRGLDALAMLPCYFSGIAVLFLSRTLALLYIIHQIHEDQLQKRCHKQLLWNALITVVSLVTFLVMICLGKGYNVLSDMNIELLQYKYWYNIIEMPLNTAVLLVGIVLVLWGIISTLVRPTLRSGIWFSGIGSVLTVVALFGLAGYNNTAFYPSTTDINSSLTLTKASSSYYTLRTMSWVSLFIPVVLAYIWYAWKSITKGGLSTKGLESEEKKY
ncbi:MAG: cytochrome d ubiquinol oxidase subunit II [Marinifilaceae bacterium]